MQSNSELPKQESAVSWPGGKTLTLNRSEPLKENGAGERGSFPLHRFNEDEPGNFCGDVRLRRLSGVPADSIPSKPRCSALYLDTDCGGFYSIDGSDALVKVGESAFLAVVFRKATLIPPEGY